MNPDSLLREVRSAEKHTVPVFSRDCRVKVDTTVENTCLNGCCIIA